MAYAPHYQQQSATGRWRAAFLLLFLLASLLVAGPRPARAADNSLGQGIQISPVLIDLNGEKGGSYVLKVTVTNVTAGTLVLKSNVNDFKAKDETGNPQVLLKDDPAYASYSLKTWVGAVPDLTLKAKESRSLAISVTIPPNAEAGGHYGVIRFSGVPPELSDANVALTASVGLLLLARVEGKTTENLSVKSLDVRQGGHPHSLVANGPVDILARIENTGNVHVKPIGTLTVKDTFGKVVANYPLGSNSKNILPHSIRAYSQRFNKAWLFGHYTVNLQAAYGTTGAVLQSSTAFWVIPIKLILFLILLVAVIILGLKRLLRAYNKRVIARAQTNRGDGPQDNPTDKPLDPPADPPTK